MVTKLYFGNRPCALIGGPAMKIDLNELLLYGGGTVAALSVIAGIIFLCAMLRKRKKLAAVLDKEYGKK